MFRRPVLAGLAAAAALLGGFPASSETFTPLPDQTYDVDQPGPRGDIAIWLVEPPASFNAVRACANIVSLDPHRLFAPAFSVVLVAGDEVLRLRFINEDRRSTVLPAYLRRESIKAPDTALTTGSRRKVKREVRMRSTVEVGKPFDLGLSWTPEGKVDVMVKTGGREEHISVTMKTAPTRVRVIASSGYWKLLPFEFGIMDPAVNPDPDAPMLSGCPSPPPPPDET